jgi:hypothetical protein
MNASSLAPFYFFIFILRPQRNDETSSDNCHVCSLCPENPPYILVMGSKVDIETRLCLKAILNVSMLYCAFSMVEKDG